MPHIHVKIVGKSEEEKTRLAQAITQAVMSAAQSKESNISITIEDIRLEDWVEQVYKPDIVAKRAQLYKKPDYNHV